MRQSLWYFITLVITIVAVWGVFSYALNPLDDCWAEHTESSIGVTAITHVCGINGTIFALLNGYVGAILSILSLVIAVLLFWFPRTSQRRLVFSAVFLGIAISLSSWRATVMHSLADIEGDRRENKPEHLSRPIE